MVEIGGRAPFIGIIRFVADIIATDGARASRGCSTRSGRWRARPCATTDCARSCTPCRGCSGPGSTCTTRWGDVCHCRVCARRPTASRWTSAERSGVCSNVGRRRVSPSRRPGGPASDHRAEFSPARCAGGRGLRAPRPGGRDLVATVVALASVALEQQNNLQTSVRAMRAGVSRCCSRAATPPRDAQRRGAGRSAAAPCVVGVCVTRPPRRPARRARPRLERPPPSVPAERGTTSSCSSRDGRAPLAALVERRGLVFGTARHDGGEPVADTLRRAAQAAREAVPGTTRAYDELAGRGLVGRCASAGRCARPLAPAPLDALRRRRASTAAGVGARVARRQRRLGSGRAGARHPPSHPPCADDAARAAAAARPVHVRCARRAVGRSGARRPDPASRAIGVCGGRTRRALTPRAPSA